MLDNETINKLLGINEAYEMPQTLLNKLTDRNVREKMFDDFLMIEQNLSYDWFTNYYQEEQGDRKKLKQDFTPDDITAICSAITGSQKSYADICAGTGGMTIKVWNENKNATFYCEELSTRAVPVLLFNLAIRNINAVVANGDSLQNKFDQVYRLTSQAKYSDITIVDHLGDAKVDGVYMNPPYSVKWVPPIMDERFVMYGEAPTSKADYAFVLHGLSKLNDNGKLLAILPHGVLFRDKKEKQIRAALINDNLLDAVIGLPDKMFLNTSIPTVIIVLKKNRANKDILFIDASKKCVSKKPYNAIPEEHRDEIIDVYKNRKEINKFSRLVTFEEVKENDFNLNIPRYVDTSEEKEVVDIGIAMLELIKLEKEAKENEKAIADMMLNIVGFDDHQQKAVKEWCDYVKSN